MIIKGALVPLQTYAMNMDRIWRPKNSICTLFTWTCATSSYCGFGRGCGIRHAGASEPKGSSSAAALRACCRLHRCLTIDLNLACGWDGETSKSCSCAKRKRLNVISGTPNISHQLHSQSPSEGSDHVWGGDWRTVDAVSFCSVVPHSICASAWICAVRWRCRSVGSVHGSIGRSINWAGRLLFV